MKANDHPAKTTAALIREMRQKYTLLETQAALQRAECRRRIIGIARDLLPQAASFARKGRPRLLAVITKIIGDEKLRSIGELKA
jgi:hypothetical protein